MSGPRIYLAPLTAASGAEQWTAVVADASAMNFDWLALRPAAAARAARPALAPFVARAADAQLRVMTELDAGEADLAGRIADDLAAGVRGFRCAAALTRTAGEWRATIDAARAQVPGIFFAADTLGTPAAAAERLRPAAFDAFFNSACWWNARDPWFLEEYDRLRRIAPSIAFPESWDGPRLAPELEPAEPDAIAAAYRFRYALAAFVSNGILMPMGYEYGWSRAADPNRPEPKRFDLRAYIAGVNAITAAHAAFGEDGPQQLLLQAGRAIGLRRTTADGCAEAVALFAAPELTRTLVVTPPPSLRADGDERLTECGAPHGAPIGETVRLEPGDIRIFATPLAQTAPPLARAALPASADPRSAARACSVENVVPQIDGGRFPVKTIAGRRFVVETDAFREGHDRIAAVLSFRAGSDGAWQESALVPLGNDRWRGWFEPAHAGRYEYAVEAWADEYGTWHHDAGIKRAAGQTIAVELLEGRALVAAAHDRAPERLRSALAAVLAGFDDAPDSETRAELLLADRTLALVTSAPDRSRATRSATFPLTVDRRAAQIGAWYEFFPRSAGPRPGVHATLRDAANSLARIESLGFDVVYLPPIHPIGHAFRKGRNNSLTPGPDDPGSPWAIGNAAGGHTAIEPQLGTLADFDSFVRTARDLGLEVALDYALQCSPDHPWVREHPEWFTIRPDGTIKYAENPPKKYQDIVNFNWFGPHAPAMWEALRDVVLFWADRGVRIFRVDNPHTKAFAFWEWMIADVQRRRPDVLFLAEAFTRPKIMLELAKAGFTQSYTYFTWRNTRAELTAYLEELARPPFADVYRPNFFVNTPDILPPFLQSGARAAFLIRLYLAATLSSLYGVYSGFEILESAALPGREEYADSEKYELRFRDWNAAGNIDAEIRTINRIRRENAAFEDWRNVRFLESENGDVLFYMKSSAGNTMLIAVNLNPFAGAHATLHVPLDTLGIGWNDAYEVEELLSGQRIGWRGDRAAWWFDPARNPAAIFRIDARTPLALEVPA